MTPSESISGDHQPARSVDRRGLMRGLGAVLGSSVLSGCQGLQEQTIREEATPVGIPKDKLGELGFEAKDTRKITKKRSRKIQDVKVKATVISYLTQYTDKQLPGTVAFFSTPPVGIFGIELNPVVKNSLPELLRNRGSLLTQAGDIPTDPASITVKRVDDPTETTVDDETDVYLSSNKRECNPPTPFCVAPPGVEKHSPFLGTEINPDDLVAMFVPADDQAYYAIATKVTAEQTGDTVIAGYVGHSTNTGSTGAESVSLLGSDGLFSLQQIQHFTTRFIGTVLPIVIMGQRITGKNIGDD